VRVCLVRVRDVGLVKVRAVRVLSGKSERVLSLIRVRAVRVLSVW